MKSMKEQNSRDTREYRSLIHDHGIRFLGIFLRVLRLEVSVYNVHIANQSQTTFESGGEGEKILFLEVTVNSKEEIY
jgi:hypothetical protein